ncbi:MAG: HYR domain-containing protein [Bacteroidetes bacterium]|nr:MAG: HYR domain-containing protein [Bacteroidota bacterium]
MKRTVRFFTILPIYLFPFSSNILTMNSNLTQRWLVRIAMPLVVLLVFSQQAWTQCSITWPGNPNPVQINLVLDPNTGTALLNRIVTNAAGITSGDCGPINTDNHIRFYTNVSKTVFYNPGAPYEVDFDCADAGSSITVWVALNDGSNGPLMINPPGESEAIPVQIALLDQTLPTAGPFPADVTVNTSDDGGNDCTLTDIFGSTLQDIGIFGINFGPPGPNEFVDNCLDDLTVTYQLSGATTQAEGPAPFLFPYVWDAGLATFNVGVTTVTYRVYDDLADPGHSSPLVITVNVTVIDDENPTIACPANQNVGTDPGLCSHAIAGLAAGSYTDNCGVTAITWSAPGATPVASPGAGINTLNATFPVGTTTVTFTATDAGGLTNTCAFDVNVTDTEAPVITCPADQTVSASMPPGCNYTAGTELDFLSATDNCGVVSTINNINGTMTLNTEVFTLGTTNIVWTAEDAEGNTHSCSLNLMVIDDTKPAGPDSSKTITVNVTLGDCSATVSYEYPGLFFFNPDDCTPPISLTEGPAVVNGMVDPAFLNSLPPFDPFSGRMNFLFGAGATLTFPVGQTIIPYTWSDGAGNDSTELIIVNVLENVAPTAKCKPGLITLPVGADGMATLTTAMVDNGSFDNCALDTLYLDQSAFSCADLTGLVTVTLTAEDASGNTATCTASVDIVDNIAPQILCPGNKTVTTNSGCTAINIAGIGLTEVPANTALMAGQYSDNCGVTMVTWQLSGATTGSGSGSVPMATAFNKGVTTVTYTVKDASGNNAVCNFSVNVVDNTPPVWNNVGPAPGSTIMANANIGGCLGQVSWDVPGFTDACTPPVTVTSTHMPGSFFVFGTTTVTYTAIDGVGNVATHTFNVVIVDTQAPTANCKDITVSLDGAGTVTVTAPQVDNLSVDNCFFTFTSPSATYDCTDLGDNNYTLQITDGSGNTATCVAVVTVVDPIPPVALCNNVSPIDLDANGSFTLDATTVNNNSTDNTYPLCDLTYDISVDGGAFGPDFTFDCSHLGTRLLTLQVTDKDGNTATCTQNVLVRDVTPPTLMAPANVTINCDESTAPANTGTYSNVEDNCDPDPDVVQLADAFIAGSCANEFTIIRSWRATDASGNSAVVSHSIFVHDVDVPVFNIQNTIILEAANQTDCDAAYNLELTQDSVSDNCTTDFLQFDVFYTVDYPSPSYGYVDVPTPTAGTVIPGGGFPVGTTVVVWRVVDECGNSSTASVSITVEDNEGPIFTNGYEANCGKAYVLPNTSGACSNLFTWARPNASFPNVEDCLDFTVTEVIDNPTVQAAINLTNPFNYYSMVSFQVFPTAQFPVGITTVTYIATDDEGNTTECSFTVEVEDIQPPTLTCPPNQTLAATCPSAQVPDYTNLAQISDNCPGNVVLSQDYPAGTTLGSIFAPNPPAAGSQFSVTITGDEGYNTSTCTFTVTLEDGDAPIPTVATLPDLIDSCGTLIVLAPTALDPCNPGADTIYGTPSTPVGTFLNTNPPSYQLNPGNYVITWVYNDGNGNISTQPQNITVLTDIFPPVAICVPNLTVSLDPVTGEVGISPTQINNGSYDPNDCGPLTFSVSPDTLSCANAGPSPTTVTLTVRDAKNNPATCTTSVMVEDVTPPQLSAPPANITVEACDTIPAPVQLTSSDACGGTSMITATEVSTQDTSGGFLKYNYEITRTWETSDPSGNTAVATQVVYVEDTESPVFAGAPTMVMVTTDPDRETCDDTVSINILPFVSDCASGPDLSVTNSKEPGDGGNLSAIFGVGTHTVVFTATDITGNSSTYSVTVVVKDGTPPTAVCINGVSAALQPSGTVVVNTAQFNNNSSDNCPGVLNLKIQRLDVAPLQTPSNTLTYDCDDADGVTQHPVKLFVTDQAGNMSMCETFIVIQDNVNPMITLCPADQTVLCTDTLSVQTYGMALATDNCPDNLSISFADTISVDSMSQFCYMVNRTWTAIDLAGNTSACVQVFNVIDSVPPVLSQYPLNITISCSENLSDPLDITASDNCSDSLAVTFVQDTIDIAPGLCGKYSYTISRTRTAVDDCGNVETHTNTITVVDDEAPQFPGLPDTITVFSANFPANDSCHVPVTLNVAQFIVDCAPVDELVVLNDAPHGNDSLDASGSYAVGSYMIHFMATDPCGNVGEDSVLVVVVDNSKPTAICNNNVVISLGTDGTATIQADDIDLGSTDNCGIDTMFLDVATFDCGDLGVQPVTLTVVDPYGNSNTCTVNVEVTLGNNAGFSLNATSTPETYFGADDGTATASATGGSGMFTFMWSNGADSSFINALSAGTYIVTVTDEDTGCAQTDTVDVEPGVKLTVIAGTAGGTQGQIIQVPVTVDNFFAMMGMSFSMHVTNMAVGTIIDATDAGALPGTLTLSTVGNDLTVFWVGDGTPLDLPNGTVLFFLNVQLGVAPIGSTSPVTIDGTPTVLSFQQDSLGSIIPTMAMLTNGMVTIDSMAADDLEIAGIIKTWSGVGTPVPGVEVTLSGSVSGSVTTDVPGTYSFMVPPGSNTSVVCSKTVTSGFSQGINVGDLLAIQNHAASVSLLTNPYQFVAGDVNGNNKVDLPDYLLIQQLILGTVQHYSNGAPDWKFIPSDYVFPMPDPLSAPYPLSIEHTPANMDFLMDDFTAVRIGDVTGNAPVNNINDDSQDRSGSTFRFRLDEQAVTAGTYISVPFKSLDFTQRQAYQMTIAFDPTTLELTDIQPGVLPGMSLGNFGTAHLADGYLTNLWVGPDALTLADGEVLFTLTFRVLENTMLSEVLRPSSAVTFAEGLDADGNSLEIEFDFSQGLGSATSGTGVFALNQNRPNPFREQTTISFHLPQAGRAVLRVFSMEGRLVKTVVGNFAQGYNAVEFHKGELGASGVYWYELETATNSDRKKMILIE